MDDLRELIQLLGAANGADRTVDLRTANALFDVEWRPWRSGARKHWGYEKDTDRVLFYGTDSVPQYTHSLDAAVALVNKVLPGWWWSCGNCELTNDASVYVPGSRAACGPDFRASEASRKLLDHPTMGRVFDAGFDCDRVGGNVCISLLIAMCEALTAINKATNTPSPRPEVLPVTCGDDAVPASEHNAASPGDAGGADLCPGCGMPIHDVKSCDAVHCGVWGRL
jgi:hypothetical protein